MTVYPNGVGLPNWPRDDLIKRTYVRLSSALRGDVQLATDLRGDICRFLLGLMTAAGPTQKGK